MEHDTGGGGQVRADLVLAEPEVAFGPAGVRFLRGLLHLEGIHANAARDPRQLAAPARLGQHGALWPTRRLCARALPGHILLEAPVLLHRPRLMSCCYLGGRQRHWQPDPPVLPFHSEGPDE
jgi:hypothetical protein